MMDLQKHTVPVEMRITARVTKTGPAAPATRSANRSSDLKHLNTILLIAIYSHALEAERPDSRSRADVQPADNEGGGQGGECGAGIVFAFERRAATSEHELCLVLPGYPLVK
jgi:hypothetical protein